jgi:DNA-directed RNA polymerase specialized sigma24 family protein
LRWIDALPQIVAVVEAAEDLPQPHEDEDDHWTLTDTDDLRAVAKALAALDEALS